jgi:hypothetical protein
MTSSRALVVPSRLLKVFTSTCLSFFLPFIELSNLQVFLQMFRFFSPCFSMFPLFFRRTWSHRGEASVQLRTRLIIANTTLKGQTKVLELAMRMALFQGELPNSANWRPLDFCMVREAAGWILALRKKRCQFAIRPSALQHYTAHLLQPCGLGQMPCFNDPVESLARCYAPTQPVTVARHGNFNIKLVFNRCPTLKKPQ